MAQDISGFTLFVLCHTFGRRGRAMARSLAEQQDCPVPVRLVVFYNRPEDAALISEGASAQINPGDGIGLAARTKEPIGSSDGRGAWRMKWSHC